MPYGYLFTLNFLHITLHENLYSRCPPQPDLGIVVELQAAGNIPGAEHDQSRLITRAWTKIPLFDSQERLMAGRHRLPLRAVPIKPYIPIQDLGSIPQVKQRLGSLDYHLGCKILNCLFSLWSLDVELFPMNDYSGVGIE